MKSWKDFFKGKRVTLMGLGLLGRGLGDAIFLAKHLPAPYSSRQAGGAELIVTDLRDEKTLTPSLAKLKKFKNIRYTLGQHKREDFRDRDFILKAAGVPLDSPYIAEAQKHGIPIEMDASLFAKLMPKGVTLVGVTGTRGKSTVTALIYEILSSSPPFLRGRLRGGSDVKDKGLRIKDSPRVFRGGNLVPEATLPLLEKVRAGDIVVLELDSWQLQGFHDAKISPQVAVFTTFLDDHLLYYKGNRKQYFEDKVAIFKYQKVGDVLIAGEQVAKRISPRFDLKSGKRSNLKRTFTVARVSDIPKNWKIPLLGEHNLENIACAVAVARCFKIPEEVIKKAIENFKPVPGRLEFLREVRGVKIYNDNNATTPDATIAALHAISSPQGSNLIGKKVEPLSRRVVLIMGGTDKGLDRSKLVAEIPKHCKALVLLNETGTEKLLAEFPYLSSSCIKGGAPAFDFPRFNLDSGKRSNLNPRNQKRGAEDLIISQKETLKECVGEAMQIAEKGDIVLFSPAFASFGKWFKNEYDRGNQFVELIKKVSH